MLSSIFTKAKSVQGWNTVVISGQEPLNRLSPALTEYKAVFATLLGTACFHPCSLFLTDVMLPVSPCCTDTTTGSAPRNSRRWFLPSKHLPETQDLPQMPIPISLRLNLHIRISICKAFSHEQQPYGIHSLPIASQTAITLFLSRKGLIEFSFCLSSPCNP